MKNYLVTGASSGFGLAVCKDLLNKGHKIFAIARNKEKFIEGIGNFTSGYIEFYEVDLSNLESIEVFFKSNVSEKLDGLIHCAGIEETAPLTLYNPSKVENIFRINVFSTIELIRFFSKKNYSNDNASIILFSSVMGVLGQAGKIGYCSTKAAILGIVKSSALELSKRKIRVNAILPGVVDTPMTDKLFSQLEQNQIDNIINMHPLGIGKVEYIVSGVEYLLNDGSEWMTGQNLIIDGGYSIQ